MHKMAVNQIKGGAILSYVSLVIGNIIVLLYTPFMLRMMGQSEYGIYSICNTISSTIAMLDAGLALAAVKFITENKDNSDLPSIIGTFFVFYTGLGLLALAISGCIAENATAIFSKSMTSYEISSVRIILWVTGVYLALSFLTSVFVATVVAYERFIFIKILDIIRSCLLPLLIIPFLLEGYKAIAMSTITVCVFLSINVAKMIYCLTKLKIRITLHGISPVFVKQAVPFAVLIFVKLLLDNVYWSGGHLILGIVAGTIPAAVFAVALQMKGYFCAVANPVNNLFLPRCVSLSKEANGMQLISQLFIKVSRIQTILLGLVVSGYVVFGEQFMVLWAGSDYIDAYRASLIIMIPYMVPLAQGILNSVLQAYNKLRYQLAVFVIICLIVVIGSFILGRLKGAMGAAYVLVFVIVIFEIIVMNLYYSKLGLNIKSFWYSFIKIMMPYVLVTVLSKFLLANLDLSSWYSWIISLLTFVVAAMSLEWFLVMNTEEKEYVIELWQRALKRKKV